MWFCKKNSQKITEAITNSSSRDHDWALQSLTNDNLSNQYSVQIKLWSDGGARGKLMECLKMDTVHLQRSMNMLIQFQSNLSSQFCSKN